MGIQEELVVSTLSVLFMLPQSIQQLGEILPSSLLDEKTEVQTVDTVPQVTQLVCSRAGIIQHCIFWPFIEMQNQFASFQQTLEMV